MKRTNLLFDFLVAFPIVCSECGSSPDYVIRCLRDFFRQSNQSIPTDLEDLLNKDEAPRGKRSTQRYDNNPTWCRLVYMHVYFRYG